MSQKTWSAVDNYIAENLLPADTVLEAALRSNRSRGLPEIDVSPAQGKLLYLLARMNSAKRILEIGTLGGYSTIWLARALPADGKVVTLELDPHHADVAQVNFKHSRAFRADRSARRTGAEVAGGLSAQKMPRPFDLVFIDADKPNNPNYLTWAMRLSRPGTVIVCDNVIRDGAVLDRTEAIPMSKGRGRRSPSLRREARLEATAIQTVGAKGYDGFDRFRRHPVTEKRQMGMICLRVPTWIASMHTDQSKNASTTFRLPSMKASATCCSGAMSASDLPARTISAKRR